MKNFRTYQLALELYEKGQRCQISSPIIKDQFDRASLSVVLNLSEGSGRFTAKDRKHFYTMAYGSIKETQTCLYIIKNEELIELADKVAAHIFKLVHNSHAAKHAT